MSKTKGFLFSVAAAVAMVFTFSCSSGGSGGDLPPPLEDTNSSSSEEVSGQNYCIYPEAMTCFSGLYSECPGGGVLSDACPYSSNSSGVSSSSLSISYSSEGGGSESSGSGSEGESSNSGSVSSSSGDVELPSSSAGVSSSSPSVSSSGGGGNCPTASGNVFVDQRDCKTYKYETDPNGRVWMSENLNYSRNNTLGYCYGVLPMDGGANSHRDSTSCGNGYGRIYEYAVAIDGKSPQGLCPSGWHIPSTAEWSGINTGKMSSGFYIYPGNYNLNSQYPPVGWKEKGENGFYWTSSGNSYFSIWNSIDYSSIEAKTGATSVDYYSVRCIADDGSITFDCNGVPYSPSAGFCSDGNVYARCGGKEYTPSAQFCSDGNVYAKCGGKEYTPSAQFCSGTSVYEKCNGAVYRPANQVCQGTSVYEQCNGVVYDPANQACCNGELYLYNPNQVCQGTVMRSKCGTYFYDPSTHFCSGSTPYAKCGGEEYNPANQECVGNVVVPIDLPSSSSLSASSTSSASGGGNCSQGTMCLYNNGDCWPTDTQTKKDNCARDNWLYKGGDQGEGTLCNGGTFITGCGINNTPPTTVSTTSKGCCRWNKTIYTQCWDVFTDEEVSDCKGDNNQYWSSKCPNRDGGCPNI